MPANRSIIANLSARTLIFAGHLAVEHDAGLGAATDAEAIQVAFWLYGVADAIGTTGRARRHALFFRIQSSIGIACAGVQDGIPDICRRIAVANRTIGAFLGTLASHLAGFIAFIVTDTDLGGGSDGDGAL